MIERALGKGEVVSSILTGSTMKARQITAFRAHPFSLSGNWIRNEARNAQVHPWKNRGLCSAPVLSLRANLVLPVDRVGFRE